MSVRRVPLPRGPWVLLASLILLALFGSVWTGRASAATSSIAILPGSPNPQPSGQASRYTINFTCSAVVGNSCGPNPTITIPLDVTSTLPNTPPMTGWDFNTTSSISGLISSAAVMGGNYVITLNESALAPGESDTITLDVTPPNNTTPDGVTWSLNPSFETDDIPAVTPTAPATGGATASTHLSVSKDTNDGGSVYVIGNEVTYTIKVGCNTGNATGNLFLTDGGLTDTLPNFMTFVSATPAPTTAPPAGPGGTLAWDVTTLPPGCSGPGATSATYSVTARLDPGTPDHQSVVNDVQLSGTPIGSTTPDTTAASKAITAVDVPPTDPGNFLSKSSLGPLNIPGLGFSGTYAGHWIPTVNPRPASTPGAAEGQYTVSINYAGASGAFQTDLADPVPCLDDLSGVIYSSSSPSGQINGAGSIDNLCQHPAFNPTVVQVSAFSLATAAGAAPPNNWTPIGIRPDGTTFALTLNGTAGASAYFEIPGAEVGNVAAIELPQNVNLTDPKMTMTVWGYGDASLVGGNVLHDVATASAYPTSGGGAVVTRAADADLFIEPSTPQLGVFKSWGTLNAGPGGSTTVNLRGTLALQSQPTGNVVLTDLLPFGLSWSNPTATAGFTVSASQGGASTTVNATVTDTPNFNSSGRELIRVELPASAFTSGYYTITAPANFIQIAVPRAATTYNNTDEEFIEGIGQATASACGPGNGTTASTFESSDPQDLDGDGQTAENYCEFAASITVPPSGGPAFNLVKSVQGDQDSAQKFAPGIGNASEAGSGVYTLLWSNTGGSALTDPVVYDILPYIGDTGVSEGQATTPRDSEFAPTFAGLQGAVPANVTVAYSASLNPCRPEVYANADNPGCVDDWTTTAPSDLATVKALRLTATGTWAAPSSFSVSLKVNVPTGQLNTVAWNSAASDAVSNGTALLPAEPPKVGLTAPAPPATPTVSSSTSSPEVQPGDPIFDAVTVGHTGGGTGELHWTLLGPVAPAANGSCAGLDWAAAATVDGGTLPVTGDGTYTTPTLAPTRTGCYGYAEQITGSLFSGPVSLAAGAPSETVLVHASGIATTASAARILPGGSVTDAITISGRGTGQGTLDWTLVGPVTPAPDGTCAGLNWSTAPSADHGSIAITGAGGYRTTPSTLGATGCYSYAERLTDDSVGGPATSTAGAAGETVLVARPVLSTTVSSASVPSGHDVSDQITVSGTGGAPGSLSWRLVGPVAPVHGSCAHVSWSAAHTLHQGTIAVTGDGIHHTAASPLAASGCYGYAVTLDGDSYGGPVVSDAGTAGEVVLARPAPVAKAAQVTVDKRVDQARVMLGQPLTYTVTAHNTGHVAATHVRITDAPATRMTLVSAKGSSAHCSRAFPVTCTIGRLRAGRDASITIVARPLAAGRVVNTAHVRIAQANAARARSTFGSAAAKVMIPLRLTKTAQRRTVRAGHRVRYAIGVVNHTNATARHVKVCDRLPAGLVFVSASVHTRVTKGVRCWTIASVPHHSSRTFTVTARALTGARGRLVNRATLTGPADPRRTAHAAVTVRPTAPRASPVTG